MGLFDGAVKAYRKLEMGLIESLSGSSGEVLSEAGFYDVGYMRSRTERIKKEIHGVTAELDAIREMNDPYGKERKSELIKKHEGLIGELVFYGTNSPANLENCLKMAEGLDHAVCECIRGMICFRERQYDEAYALLDEFHRKHGEIRNHFLFNRDYGFLLMRYGKEAEAIRYLSYALQHIPDDLECLKALEKCCRKTGDVKRGEAVNEILSLLA